MKSAKDFTPPSMPDTEKAGTPASFTDKLQGAAPPQSWAQRVGQQVIGIHTDANNSEVSRGNAKEDALTPYALGKLRGQATGAEKTLVIAVLKPSPSNALAIDKATAEKPCLRR
jgi:hypothetical protein